MYRNNRATILITIFLGLCSGFAQLSGQTPPTVRTISSFSGTNGANPGSQLIELPSGNLLGVSLSAPYHKKAPSTIYQVVKGGVIQTIYNLSSDGSQGSLNSGTFGDNGIIQGSDGNVYGLMYQNGAGDGPGLVYRFTFPGTFTVLHNFSSDPSDCSSPVASLVQASDGSLYGAASNGGAYGAGGLFKVGLDGSYQKIYDFQKDAVGLSPYYGLVAHPDGMIYGLTSSSYVDGIGGNGVIFQLNPATSVVSVFARSANAFYTLPAIDADGSLEVLAGAPASCEGCSLQLLSYGADGSGPQIKYTILSSQGASANSAYLSEPAPGVYLDASNPLLDINLAGGSLTQVALPPRIASNASGGYTQTSGGNLFAAYPQTSQSPYFGAIVELSGGFPKPPPAITSAFPASVSQGQTVTIIGSHFVGATGVSIGQQPVVFTVKASGAITFSAPAGPLSGAVSVTNAGGTTVSKAVVSVN